MTTILRSFFPAEKNRLDDLADQAAMSRLFGGIHYRVDDDTGLRLGRTVATWALCHQPAEVAAAVVWKVAAETTIPGGRLTAAPSPTHVLAQPDPQGAMP